jgi:hypothetical protein
MGAFSGGMIEPSAADHATVELYDPTRDVWLLVGPSAAPRTYGAIAALGGERAVLLGGADRYGASATTVAEIFEQRAAGSPCTAPAQCVTFACVAGACATTCKADTDCIDGTWCRDGACVVAKQNGEACDDAHQCVSANCIDGFCCGAAKSCAPYVCGADSCRTTCETGQCAPGFVCTKGACVPSEGGTCSKDGTVSTGKDGDPHSCAPYRCDSATGSCLQQCAKTEDCISGFTCDLSSKLCTTGPTASDDGGGCATTGGRSHGVTFAAFGACLAFAIGIIRRKRR